MSAIVNIMVVNPGLDTVNQESELGLVQFNNQNPSLEFIVNWHETAG